MNKLDINDLKSVLNDQFDLIQRFGKMPVSSLENWKEYQTIYLDILKCNEVMMEILTWPTGKIEKLGEDQMTDKVIQYYLDKDKTVDIRISLGSHNRMHISINNDRKGYACNRDELKGLADFIYNTIGEKNNATTIQYKM